jgi:L-ascorbate metabolism protein UlaG (beta-lactamase superfamily)
MIKDITYVLGWPHQKDIDYYYIAPGQTGNVDSMEIRTVKTGGRDEESVGFLVKVDGLKVFHAGNDTCTKETNVGKFLEAICYMGGDWSNIDIAFLPVHGKGGHYQNRETLLFIKEFQPHMVFPLYSGGKDHYYREFSAEVAKERLETVINYTVRSAERFFYQNRNVR